MVVLEFNASCLECIWFHDEKCYSKTLLILLSLYVLINFFLSIFCFLFPHKFLLINSISFSFVDLLWVSFSLCLFINETEMFHSKKKIVFINYIFIQQRNTYSSFYLNYFLKLQFLIIVIGIS